MNSSDREGFVEQVELLCGGFNVPPTEKRIEGLWIGLRSMNLIAFTRVVEHALGPMGPERFPSSRECWDIYRDLKAKRSAPAANDAAPAVPEDRLLVITAKMLWMLMYRVGPFSSDLLQALLAAKSKLVADYRVICAEESISDIEFGEAVYAKFRQVLGSHGVIVPDFSRPQPAGLRRAG